MKLNQYLFKCHFHYTNLLDAEDGCEPGAEALK